MAIPGTIQFPALAATPSPPPVGSYILYIKTDNTMYLEDSSGNVYAFGSVDFISELTGDVSATGPGAAAATVTGIQGHAVSSTAPTDGQFLVWVSGSAKYVPTSISGDISFTDTGVTTVEAIQGYAVSTTAPTDAQILIYNSTSNKYFPESISGDATLADTGVLTLSSTAVTGKLLTGYTTGTNTPIVATDSILTAFENLQAQVSGSVGAAITALTGDVSATGPGSAAATIEAIQGTTVSGTTGTGNVVFSGSPTLTGTLSGAAATFTSTIGASNLSGTNTGNVTTTNTNSIDLAFTSGQTGLNATLNLSSAMPDSGYIPAVLEIKTDGLLVEVLAGTPVQIGTSNNIGSAASAARSDHVHAITSAVALGLLLTGYTAGSDTPITATDTLLQAFENLQAQISATSGSAITSLTGDVTATGPGAASATVVAIQGYSVSSTAPTDAQFLIYNSGTSKWTPQSMSSDATITDTGVITLSTTAVTGKLLTGYTTGTNTPITATNSILTAFENLQAQVSAISGAVIAIGTYNGGTANANGATILGNDIYFQSASSTYPGMVDNTTQTFSGNKTFSGQTAVSNASTTAFTVNTTSFVVDATNNAIGVGIDPSTLAVIDAVNSSGTTKAVQLTGYGSNVGVRGRYANGTMGSPTAATTGNIIEFISGRGYGATGFATASTGSINIVAGATFTDTSMPTYLQFMVTPTGSVTSTEAMRVNSTGNILMDTVTDNGTDTLQIGSGLISGYNKLAGATSGYVENTVPATVTTYTLTWPSAQGTSGTFLSNDGAGNLSWTNPVVNIDGGSPSSVYTSGQYISGGSP